MQVAFGEFVLDLDRRELRRGTGPVRLSPKAFRLLEILASSRPKALSKAELQDRLWPDTFVVEKNLANLVSEIRRALGETGSDVIRTVPRFGYAFQETPARDQEPMRATAPTPRRRQIAFVLGGIALCAFAAYAAFSAVGALAGDPPLIRLAVLPFQNLTGDPEQDYLCDGLTEDMIVHLGGLQPSRLGVVARTSALQYKHTSKGADEIGRELGVRYLLETSVRRAGDRLRIAVRLFDAERQTHVWAEQHDYDTHDLLALQQDVAAAVAQRISGGFGLARPIEVRTERHSRTAAAYDHYLRGRWHWAKDTAEDLQKGKEHFRKAISLDPTYSLAYSGLADTYALLGSYDIMPISHSHPLGREAALKALELDDALADGHRSLAAILADHYWDWTEAERHYKRALDLAPNDATTLRSYSFYLAYTGNTNQALPLAERAISLDPLSLGAQVNLGVILNMARRYDAAAWQFERALELDSDYAVAHAMLGLSYAYKGMPERAVSELVLARKSDGERPDFVALHGYTLARAGRTREARDTIEELNRLAKPRSPSPFLMAVVAVGLNDKDRAFEWLRKTAESRAWELPMLQADPTFDNLRSDARFHTLLDRLGLLR